MFEIKERIDDPIFEDRLRQAVAQADRTGERVALHVLEVETSADQPPVESFLLRSAQRIDAMIRDSDAATYLGDHRFAVLQRVAKSSSGVERLASQLLAAVSAPVPHGDGEVFLNATIGFGLYVPGVDSAELLQRAERALLEASETGECQPNAKAETDDRPRSRLKLLR